MSDELGRIREFWRGFARRRAPRVVEVPGGFAVLDREYAASHDDNKLIVWAGGDPGAVLAAADEVLDGYEHRLVHVDDELVGEAWAPTFEGAGYERETNLIMVFRGEYPDAESVAEEVGLDVLVPILRREWRESLPGARDEVVDQLARRVERRRRGADRVGFYGVRGPRGEPAASRADLYVQDGVAQIETLITDPKVRGGGLARALMTSLLVEAAGSDVVFLLADANDWPQEFYCRLGFETIARTHSFTRLLPTT